MRPARVEIDINKLCHNVKLLRAISNSKHFMAVVKADAYGHGAVQIAKAALKSGADCLGVAIADEGIELRKAGITAPILIFGYTPPEYGKLLAQYDLSQTVYSLDGTLKLAESIKGINKRIKVHLKIDTGMNRLGFRHTKQEINDLKSIFKLDNIDVIGVFTHFADAENRLSNFTIKQFESFVNFVELIEKGTGIKLLKHCANTAAIIDYPDTHLDMVRAGIGMYGLYPSIDLKDKILLKPVMSFKTEVAHIKKIKFGETVSYGRTYKADQEKLVATIPVGYADGYNRLLSNKGQVIIKGNYAKILGRICMDQFMVDVSHLEGNVKVGDEVVLFGEQKDKIIDVDEIAEILGTINYEIVCMVSKRVPRVYV